MKSTNGSRRRPPAREGNRRKPRSGRRTASPRPRGFDCVAIGYAKDAWPVWPTV